MTSEVGVATQTHHIMDTLTSWYIPLLRLVIYLEAISVLLLRRFLINLLDIVRDPV